MWKFYPFYPFWGGQFEHVTNECNECRNSEKFAINEVAIIISINVAINDVAINDVAINDVAINDDATMLQWCCNKCCNKWMQWMQ